MPAAFAPSAPAAPASSADGERSACLRLAPGHDRLEAHESREQPVDVALQERLQTQAELLANGRRKPLRQTEVEEQDARRGAGLVHDVHVPGVRVGVEETVPEDLPAVGVGDDREHGLGGDPARAERGAGRPPAFAPRSRA